MQRLHIAGWISIFAVCAGLWVTAPAQAVVPVAQTPETSNSEVITLRPFRASYRVSAGVLSGNLVLELEHRTGEDWVLTSVATTRGVARIFRRGELVERTVLRFTDEGVMPMEYHRDDGISGPDRNAALIFSYADGRVFGSDREHTVDLPLDGGVIDRLSMQVRLMRDLTAGLRPEEYAVVDRGEIREMDITYADSERIEAADQQLDTLRLDHQSRNSSRSTRLWVATEFNYLPVRIEQKRHGNTEWLATLQDVTWGDRPREELADTAQSSR